MWNFILLYPSHIKDVPVMGLISQNGVLSQGDIPAVAAALSAVHFPPVARFCIWSRRTTLEKKMPHKFHFYDSSRPAVRRGLYNSLRAI